MSGFDARLREFGLVESSAAFDPSAVYEVMGPGSERVVRHPGNQSLALEPLAVSWSLATQGKCSHTTLVRRYDRHLFAVET